MSSRRGKRSSSTTMRAAAATAPAVAVLRGDAAALKYILLNILSVAAIVLVNKRVFASGFNFPITLVTLHTCVTYAGLRMSVVLGAFAMKPLARDQLLILAASFVGYNTLSLINLNINTIGFYQISKILVTPAVMLLNLVAFNQRTSRDVNAAVLLMLAGVTLATVTDVDVHPTGLAIGLVCCGAAAQQQVLIGVMQGRLAASANQLLVAYTPFVIPMLALLTPIDAFLPKNTDAGDGRSSLRLYVAWYEEHGTAFNLSMILLSACLGLLVSLSTFLLIGNTSALTYNIVGHAKTILIMLSGCIFFGDSFRSATSVCAASRPHCCEQGQGDVLPSSHRSLDARLLARAHRAGSKTRCPPPGRMVHGVGWAVVARCDSKLSVLHACALLLRSQLWEGLRCRPRAGRRGLVWPHQGTPLPLPPWHVDLLAACGNSVQRPG